jgi:hypothetical protein
MKLRSSHSNQTLAAYYAVVQRSVNFVTVVGFRWTLAAWERVESDPDAQRLIASGAGLEITGGYIAVQAEIHSTEIPAD